MSASTGGSGSDGSAREAVLRDARVLATDLEDLVEETRSSLVDALERHPLLTLGTAAAAGYVLAGGLASRLTLLGLGAAARLASASLLHHFTSVAGGERTRHTRTSRRNSHGSRASAPQRVG